MLLVPTARIAALHQIIITIVIIGACSYAINAAATTTQTHGQNACVTPANETGICIPADQCPSLLRVLLDGRRISASNRRYLQESRCTPHDTTNGTDGAIVSKKLTLCCPNTNGFVCGVGEQMTTTDANANPARIIGGDNALLKGFPWMATIGFVRQNRLNFDCGGSLISDRFVLTAAHCLHPVKLFGWKP